IPEDQLNRAKTRLNELRGLIRPADLAVRCATSLSEPFPVANIDRAPQVQQPAAPLGNSYYAQAEQVQAQQTIRNNVELQAREQNSRQAATWNGKNNLDLSRTGVAEGMVKPIWLGEALVLARRVSVEGQNYIQGCWLDWPNSRKSLLQSVQDLL